MAIASAYARPTCGERLGGSAWAARSSPACLLAEQVVADLQAALGRELARLAGREQGQRDVGAVVNGLLLNAQQRSDLGVALAPAQQQRERRALVGERSSSRLIGA